MEALDLAKLADRLDSLSLAKAAGYPRRPRCRRS